MPPLEPVAKLRDSSRILLSLSALGLAALLGALFLAPAVLDTSHGAAPAREKLEGLRRADPPLRSALGDGRLALGERRGRLAGQALVDRPPQAAPQAAAAPKPDEGEGQLVAAVTPTVQAEPPTPTPDPDPAPAPPPEPEPDPSPPSAPQPDPSPPPPPPPPDPNPPPEPSPPPPPPPPDDGRVLFKATFDTTGFSGWYVQSLPGRVTTTSRDPFEGSRAARFEVRDGDVEPDTGSERSEVSGPTFNEGEDLFIRDAIRFPSTNTYSAPWQIIQQLHEEDWGGSPGIAVFLDNKPSLKLGAGDPPPTFWQSPTLEPDRWHDLIYRVFLSQDPSQGFVEVWLDGVQQTLANGQTRMYGRTIQAPQTYIKAGIYRSKSTTGTSIVEHDAIVIGTSLAAVING